MDRDRFAGTEQETSFLNARFTVAIALVLKILVCWDGDAAWAVTEHVLTFRRKDAPLTLRANLKNERATFLRNVRHVKLAAIQNYNSSPLMPAASRVGLVIIMTGLWRA